jgi:uncharacterized protein
MRSGIWRWSRRLAPLLLVLGVGVPTPVYSQAAEVGALPLWELVGGEGTVYLLGSVHLLRPEVYPLDPLIYEIFDASDLVVYELDHEELLHATPAMMRLGLFVDGRTLEDALPPELYRELVRRAGALGLPEPVMRPMKPWLAAMSLSTLVLQRAGFQPEWGIEMHFYERARRAGTATAGLETAEQQFAALDGLSREGQVALVRQTLEDLDDAAAQLDEATALWQRGDAEALARLMNEALGDQHELRERLLLERNRNWVPRIEAFRDRAGTTLVIVGMGHLAGEGSVIDLLRARGHEVTRVALSVEREG